MHLLSVRLLMLLGPASAAVHQIKRNTTCGEIDEFNDCVDEASNEISLCDETAQDLNFCLCYAYQDISECWSYCPDEPGEADAYTSLDVYCSAYDATAYSTYDYATDTDTAYYTDTDTSYDPYTYDTYTDDFYSTYTTDDSYPTTDVGYLPTGTFGSEFFSSATTTSASPSATSSAPRQTSATSSSSSVHLTATTAADSAQQPASNSSTGEIAGAAVGGFAGAALIATALFFLWRRRKTRPPAAESVVAEKTRPVEGRSSWLPVFHKKRVSTSGPTYELAAETDPMPAPVAHHGAKPV